MEILHATPGAPIRAALFDFDGTISTLRYGWEAVMREMMLELLSRGAPDAALEREVDAYIEESTGIQTIHQMKWLAARARSLGRNDLPDDPWWYKDEYNRRLMRTVSARVEALSSGAQPPEQYLIAGAAEFLNALRARGVGLYVASGTDDADVRAEARALGVEKYFARIAGAPNRAEGCAKEAALRMLVDEIGLSGERIAVIGDGKVEIGLARDIGARALGLATDEAALRGVNPAKRARLIRAGADAIAGDFEDVAALLTWMGLEDEMQCDGTRN